MSRRERRTLPPAEKLREYLRYEPETGHLFWRVRAASHFASVRICNSWNTRYAEKRAFTSVTDSGHLEGNIDARVYMAHRVIWKMVTGEEPPLLIDHEDRDPGNNRWKNFRVATKSQNNINSSLERGVFFDAARGRYMAHIKKDQRRRFLGRFDTHAEALAARKAAELDLFGEFAPQ